MDAAHYTKALRLTGKQLRADHPDTADVTLIAAKVMAASKRPQDRQDLQSLAPSPNELDFVKEHLNRIEAETEPGHCAAQERILTWLRKQKEG